MARGEGGGGRGAIFKTHYFCIFFAQKLHYMYYNWRGPMTVTQRHVLKHRAEWEWKGEGDKNCSYSVGVGGDFFLIYFF